MQSWNHVLHSRGGALEVPKVKFLVIHFGFADSGKSIMLELADYHRIKVDTNGNEALALN